MRLWRPFDADTGAMNHVTAQLEVSIQFLLGGRSIDVVPLPLGKQVDTCVVLKQLKGFFGRRVVQSFYLLFEP